MGSSVLSSSYTQLSPLKLKTNQSSLAMRSHPAVWIQRTPVLALGAIGAERFGGKLPRLGTKLRRGWSSVAGSRVGVVSDVTRFVSYTKCCGISASWLTSSQIASSAFNLGTVAVLPFYTLMVLAPKARLTRRSMESSIPYVLLGLLYAYLLYLSWSPDTIRTMFATKYLLPELSGIVKMFSNEMTLASAWIHLLTIDLFAARHVFLDGLENDVETRHSVSLCLLFCPIGILIHVLTKVLSKGVGNN